MNPPVIDINNAERLPERIAEAAQTGFAALIDKDVDWTSFDVAAKLRSLTRIKKVGHAGTLDPLATGLLILCFGRATKSIYLFQNLPKTYTGKIRLGATTRSDDAEFEEENLADVSHISMDDILKAKVEFVGKTMQTPPAFSAKKIKGARLYKLARKNIDAKPKPVEVEVNRFDILSYNAPFAEFEVECSKGTYIRSLARDLGAKLGCGGYLAKLRRTAIGEYSVDKALKIKEISEIIKNSKQNENI